MLSEKALQKRLKELIEHRDWVDKQIEAVRVLLAPPPQGVRLNLSDSPVRATRASRGGRLKLMADAIFPFLTERGKPAKREVMLQHLEQIGIEVTGETEKQKLALISSALSKDSRFMSMGRSTGQWDVDYEHLNRISKLQDRPEAPKVYQATISDSSIYGQSEKPEAVDYYEPSDADDLPW